MEKTHKEQTIKDVEDTYEDVDVGAPIPIAPDGGIAPGYGMSEESKIPPMDEVNCICLRGPCRYFWEMQTPLESTAGFGKHAQLVYTCIRSPAAEMNLGDSVVSECNMWDPLTKHELIKLKDRRRPYLIDLEEEVDEEDADES